MWQSGQLVIYYKGIQTCQEGSMTDQFVCKRCGKSFVPKDLKRAIRKGKLPQYCSHDCGKMARCSRVTLECVQCHQPFERKRYMADWSTERGPFCSMGCYAEWQRQNIAGPSNPNYQPDTHLDLECDWCGKPFRRPRWLHYRSSSGMAFCSRQCFQSFANENFQGEGNPGWRGGNQDYRGGNWQVMRKMALDRDHHRCQHCGAESGLVVHHVVPYADFAYSKEANELGNLLTLCTACHRRQHNQLRAASR